MRRSPPARSCLLGLDLRKRPFADLTPEEPAQEAEPPSPPPGWDIALVVQETPVFETVGCDSDKPPREV